MTTTPTLREAAQRLLNAIEAVHEAEKSEGHARGGFVRTAPTRAHQRRVAEAWHENAAAVQALRAALAEQAAEQAEPSEHRPDPEWYARMIRETAGDDFVVGPAFKLPEQAEPVALDVTLTEEETSFLRDTMGADEGKAPDAIRLTVGNGHSGYGLYVSLAEYGNEGSSLLKALAAPPAPAAAEQAPIDMVLHCPACGLQHIDEADPPVEFEPGAAQWSNPPHRSHLCHGCGHIWRPADIPTNGVAAIKTKGKADSPPAPARQEPLTEEQVRRGWSNISLHPYVEGRFIDGVRFAERAHGITAAPAEGGA